MLTNAQLCFLRKSVRINILKVQRRWKNRKDHWSTIAREKQHTDRALEYFDDFYKKVFNDNWTSVRLGLLSESKYCAVVNNYSDTSRIEQELETIGAINMKNLINAQISLRDSKSWKKKLNQMKKLEERENKLLEDNIINRKSEMETKQDDDVGFNKNRLIKPPSKGDDENALALYDFIPATKLKGMESFVPQSQYFYHYKSASESDFIPEIESEDRLVIPDTLKVYTFDSGNISKFPKPKTGSTGVSDYYLLDGSSILPVLCLGLEPGDKVLDMCSAPGGKSLICLQTLLVGKLVSNDASLSRLNRLRRVFKEFFYDFPKMESSEEIVLTNLDARNLSELGTFNKILVDVPCTTDKYSVIENDNNIFRPDRIKERIKLPEIQTDILTAALKLVEDGGTVVYSTCSLSPVQNDGVVQMALKRIWEETNDNIIVKDMTGVLQPYNILYKFAKGIGLRYGHLVVPYLPSNFGPMYFCKLVKRNNDV